MSFHLFSQYSLHVSEGKRMLRPRLEPDPEHKVAFSRDTDSFQVAFATISSALNCVPSTEPQAFHTFSLYLTTTL